MKTFRGLAVLFTVILPFLAGVPANAQVTVFAAASATDALNEIGKAFVAGGGKEIVPSYASSSTLAKQIENGAPANLFLSADERWMDYLADKGLLATGTRLNLLGNRVVLIAPKDSTVKVDIGPGFPLAKLLGEGRLAVGDPSHVPVGAYTEAALKKLGVWDAVQGKLAPADSVRAALAFVERGETPLGIVYATDAAVTDKVKVVGVFPEDSHPPVVYPAALIKDKDTADAKAFLAFLQGPEAKAIFQKYGFAVK
ncbi:molybdate ABC transporter substrate-binding protein [Telmatospirillum siberiense]|uniref:Molybdate ABC transporter substrate-binding protein n=1 Tax=Telmatospirillum siberiense TaxID=382514 RepID=A0A2N3PR70_9PROT|nr:molybdate ABC transporter substrate-binding protein [Telmatospirillum siberiense]PKU22898.1 molybdate ABC transporter substrate-binding protein [Telmatospirillum siberiense]